MPNREDYDRFLAEVRKETGIGAMVADEAGLVTVRVDDKYNVNLQFVEATGRILCFVEVAALPTDAPKEVYRDLLAGGLFGAVSEHLAAGGFPVTVEGIGIPDRFNAQARQSEQYASCRMDSEGIQKSLQKVFENTK